MINSSNITKIILIRHGQTSWNQQERFRGRSNIPLDETGLSQAEVTGQRVVTTWHPSAVYSSPLKRAVQTAEKIALPLGLSVQTHNSFIDIDYGEWQGLSTEEARGAYPALISTWYHTPHKVKIPGGETLDAVQMRAMTALYDLINRHPGETIALVSHVVVNRLIILAVLGASTGYFWRLRQEPCAINQIDIQNGELTLGLMNGISHLMSHTRGEE